MTLRLLLLADIHGNYPALQAIDRQLDAASFDLLVNCGDSLVYSPFPNECLHWLAAHRVISILGNTDEKVKKLLLGQSFKKPSKPEKRIMYSSTASALSEESRRYLYSLGTSRRFCVADGGKPEHRLEMALFHGSPTDKDEFLFAGSPDDRFQELAAIAGCQLVVTGHSHSPYHKTVAGVHFINPGSVGRMFDGDPRASCATLEIEGSTITVHHFRIEYPIGEVVAGIRLAQLPEIYATMVQLGKKLN